MFDEQCKLNAVSGKVSFGKGSGMSIYGQCGLMHMKSADVPVAVALATPDDHRKHKAMASQPKSQIEHWSALFRATVVLEQGTDCYRFYFQVVISNEVSRSVGLCGLRVSLWLAVKGKS